MGLQAVLTGLTLVQKFVDEWSPKTLRVWLISDSTIALRHLWWPDEKLWLKDAAKELIAWATRRFAAFSAFKNIITEEKQSLLSNVNHSELTRNIIHWQTETYKGCVKSRCFQNPDLFLGRERCPVVNCKNNNNSGWGYKDLQGHLERSHKDLLRDCEGSTLEAITRSLERIHRTICQSCRKIRAKINEDGICSVCWKESINKTRGEINVDIGKDDQESIILRIISANKTRMMVIKSVPKVMHQWWSKAVTITLTVAESQYNKRLLRQLRDGQS